MTKDKTRQDKTRQDKTRQDKTRQDNYDGRLECVNRGNRIIFLGNIYGFHDGYDGSVFSLYGISPTITSSGIRCVIENE